MNTPARQKAAQRRSLPRLFIVANYSPITPYWSFMTARGIDEARRKAGEFLAVHHYGRTAITKPEVFRPHYLRNKADCRQFRG